MIFTSNSKQFENPDSGTFTGVIADVVDLGPVTGNFGTKIMTRIVWVLGKPDGSGYALDSEGKPYRVIKQVNAVLCDKPKKSNLYTIVEKVLGQPPSTIFDGEDLIGRSNQLFIVKQPKANGNGDFANIVGILPLPAGVKPLAIPGDFVRSKDKNATPGNASSPSPAPAHANPALTKAVIPQTTAPVQVQQEADVAF